MGKGEKLNTDGKEYPNVLHSSAHSVEWLAFPFQDELLALVLISFTYLWWLCPTSVPMEGAQLFGLD